MRNVPFGEGELEEEPSAGERPFGDAPEALFRRRWLIAFCVAIALLVTAAVTVSSKPMYRATTILNLDRERNNLLDLGTTPTRENPPDPDSLGTETQLMRSREVAERVAAKLKRAEFPDGSLPKPEAVTAAALGIQRNIEIRSVRGTNLIELSYVAASPKVAADLANAVAEAFIDWKLDLRFRVIGQASKFLASQIEEAKQTLSEKEQLLLALGRQKDILSIAPQSNVTLSKLNAISQDATNAMAERIAKDSRYQELMNASPDSLPESLATGPIQQQRADLARLEREYAEKLSVFKPEFPAMQSLRAQIEKARQNLEITTRETVVKAREAAKADYQAALRREESLKDALQRQRAEAMSMSRDAVDYNNRRIEVETQRALVDNLLKRQAEMQVLLRLQGERLTNVRIVESALPPKTPFKPSYPRNAVLALVFGLAGGVGLALLLESLDRSLRSPEQVAQYLKLPVLGIIPPARAALDLGYGYGYAEATPEIEAAGTRPAGAGTKARKRIAIERLPHEHPRSVVAEAYRSFRTSLLFSRADGVRTVVVTSAVPLEGKSSTATNLAIVLGQLDRRVLLVDSDLRRSRIHEILNVSNRAGLVSVLAARMDLDDAFVATSLPNVYVLPAGPAAPDPSGLLSSDAMSRFLLRAGEEFDNVIFDSPPILASADAILLGALTDGVILCVRAGQTPRERVARARDELRRSRVHILGVLMNDLKDESRKGVPYRSYVSPEKSAPPAEPTPAPRIVTKAT